MKKGAVNIVIGGEAGQGLVTVGTILTKSLVRAGYFVVVTQEYESRIRGGHNTFSIRVAAQGISAPQESIDILVALDSDSVPLHRERLAEDGVVIVDEASEVSGDTLIRVPYKELVADKYANVVALGTVSHMLGLEKEHIARTLGDFFGKRGEETLQKNRESLAAVYRWMDGRPRQFPSLPAAPFANERLTLNGNEAIALGALSAGVKFCAFYPMTPSTSISINLSSHAQRMGIIVEQAEDEIAAINMAIGASFAGAPSMVATSGGGFALMNEGVSLAGMTETPLVIVVSQRPGPATGLPTRTEQADLEFVLHSGHGEFPRAIFAPGSVEECFHLTRKAFEIAELARTPVFILTDQFLADLYTSVEPFEVEDLPAVGVGTKSPADSTSFRTYAITPSGVSPRVLPGRQGCADGVTDPPCLVVADSDEHDEYGHITEDLAVRKAMVEKRLRKEKVIRERVTGPDVDGDDKPELLLVCWGSTKGAVTEAAESLRLNGTSVGTVHLSQVWPLETDRLAEVLSNGRQVVCVEGNAQGQLARLIRRETGYQIQNRILRYDGLPITPEYILRALDP